MAALQWHKPGEKVFETGTDRGVLYLPDGAGNYDSGEAWNGLTAFNKTPTGAEANSQYADNTKYVTIVSPEEFEATIEAFTYPDGFAECDGTAELVPGVYLGEQDRKPFGFSCRTLIGNDLEKLAYGYKLHLVYGALASPSEKNYETVNDSPEATGFSWELTAEPVAVTGYKPVASLTIDSTKVDAAKLAALEDILYGTDLEEPRLPLPDEVATLMAAA